MCVVWASPLQTRIFPKHVVVTYLEWPVLHSEVSRLFLRLDVPTRTNEWCIKSSRSSTSYLSWLLLDVEASLYDNCKLIVVHCKCWWCLSFWRRCSLCYGASGVFFAGFECLFHVLLPQALFNMDYSREYGICSGLLAHVKYRDMRKAGWQDSCLCWGCLQEHSCITAWEWMLLLALCH